MKTEKMKDNISNCKQWKRIAYMVLFGFILYFVMMVVCAVVVIQTLFALVTASTNDRLRAFANDLATYINHIVLFLTYNRGAKPFPFSPWGEALEDETKSVSQFD